MKRLLPLLALLAFLPQRGSSETVLGSSINTLPATISKAGVYHFDKNLGFTATSGNAIKITANDVIIDLNAHELVTVSGSATSSIGIYCANVDRVTIKNGTIRGFRYGVALTGNSATVTDLLLIGNFGAGITVVGDDARILRNCVYGTGGVAAAANFLSATGINLTGTFGSVTDNDVRHTLAPDKANYYGNGIRLKGCSQIVVSNNRILDVEPSTPSQGTSAGIATVTSDNLVILGNTVLTGETGFDLSGGASGKYGDNVTGSVVTQYLTTGSGMVDIGNNN